MLYLAQVQDQDSAGNATLKLLAYQKSEHTWAICAEDEELLTADVSAVGDRPASQPYLSGHLVMLTLSESRQVSSIGDGKDWVLNLVEQYLTTGITPEMLQEEAQRAEQWRQSLTLQSQEIGRRTLEIEARRDQMQELEENLKKEKQELEAIAAQLKADSNNVSGA